MMDFAKFIDAPVPPAPVEEKADTAPVIGLPINDQKRLGVKRKRRMMASSKETRNTRIETYIKKRRVANRGEVFHQHQVLIGRERKPLDTNIDFCPYCPNRPPLVVIDAEGAYACTSCGVSRDVISNDARFVPFGIQVTPMSESSYKRINHFNEYLTRFEARERTHIPQEIIDMVETEMHKHRKDHKTLKVTDVRRYLQKLKLHEYYEHRVYICCAITGEEPPHLLPSDKARFRFMFCCIQDPYERCPATLNKRENFLGYSYALHKICELLQKDDFIEYFPLPKSNEVLRQYEKIWQWICNEVGWEFIPSPGQ